MMRFALCAAWIVGCVVSCRAPSRASGDAASSDPSTVCTTIGVPCTFTPGKLGTCVEVEPATGPASLVCQSQH